MPRRRSRYVPRPPSDAARPPGPAGHLRPPTVTEAERPLRRAVAMAYRSARELGRSHHAAVGMAETAYTAARPEARADPGAASARINEMIASAINTDPTWFWKNIRSGLE
jgi:hypothetical protein